ncbi:hypothetical protein ACVI1J_008945 [Bradyrhizobium diazoefficiens]
MNDNEARSNLQGLRLIRAFLRIRDPRVRTEFVEQAERLAVEESVSVASLARSPDFAEHPANPLN